MSQNLHHEGSQGWRLRSRYRAGLLELASGHEFTHWLTLTTHSDFYTPPRALQRLKRWRVELLRELHGRKFYLLPHDSLAYYIGCLELPPSGHSHFHLLCAVPQGLEAKFDRVASNRWIDIVPSGQCFSQPIGADLTAVRDRLFYASKSIRLDAEAPFIDSRLYR